MLTKKNIAMIISILIIPSVSSAYANEKSADEFNATLGLGAISTPKYSGSNEQSWGAVPLIHLQYNNYFLDSMNGLGAHWQSDNGLYIEPTLGYNAGRTDKNSGLRKGSDKLKGMGEISGSVNTSLALGWAVKPWLVFEGKAILPLSESQAWEPSPTKRESITLVSTVEQNGQCIARPDQSVETG